MLRPSEAVSLLLLQRRKRKPKRVKLINVLLSYSGAWAVGTMLILNSAYRNTTEINSQMTFGISPIVLYTYSSLNSKFSLLVARTYTYDISAYIDVVLV